MTNARGAAESSTKRHQRKSIQGPATTLGRIALLGMALVGLVVVLITVFSEPLDLRVTDERDRKLIDSRSLVSKLMGPFRSMSKDEVDSLRHSRQLLRFATDFYDRQAWMLGAYETWCSSRLASPTYMESQLSEQATYREVLIWSNRYADALETVEGAFLGPCYRGRPQGSIEVRAEPPSVESPEGDNIGPPSITLRNAGSDSIESVEIQWEIGIIGRDVPITSDLIEETIVGGLMPGESYGVRNVRFSGTFHWSTVREVLRRLGPLEFEIRACIRAIDGRTIGSGACPPANMIAELRRSMQPETDDDNYDCLVDPDRRERELAEAIAELAAVAPLIGELVSEIRGR